MGCGCHFVIADKENVILDVFENVIFVGSQNVHVETLAHQE